MWEQSMAQSSKGEEFWDILDGDNAVVNDYVVINDELAAYMSATGQELLQKLLAIRWECGGAREVQTA